MKKRSCDDDSLYSLTPTRAFFLDRNERSTTYLAFSCANNYGRRADRAIPFIFSALPPRVKVIRRIDDSHALPARPQESIRGWNYLGLGRVYTRRKNYDRSVHVPFCGGWIGLLQKRQSKENLAVSICYSELVVNSLFPLEKPVAGLYRSIGSRGCVGLLT